MDTFRMRCFVSVAEKQSLTKAARELYISQPAMTSQMKALEKELGTKLLDRSGKVICLTPAGERALETFREVLRLCDDLPEAIRSAEHPGEQSLSVGFHGPANWLGVTNLLARFGDDRPGLDLTVVIDTWSNLLKMVETGEVDVAFMEHSEAEGLAGIEAVSLMDETICVLLPKSHPLADRRSVRARDLESETLIMPGTVISPRFLHYLVDSFGRAGLNVKTIGQGNHFEATISLALAQRGITCMPRSLARDYAGSFAIVPFDDLDISMNYELVWNRSNASTLLSEFVALAVGDLSAEGYRKESAKQ